MRSRPSILCHRLFKISFDIVDMFDADRHSDDVRTRACIEQFLLAQLAVRG